MVCLMFKAIIFLNDLNDHDLRDMSMLTSNKHIFPENTKFKGK